MKCETCRFNGNTEYDKPCIIRREDCELYEEVEDLTPNEAIERLEQMIKWGDPYEVDEDACKLAIKALEQTREWIPVSERLPEHYQNLLFSTKTDRVFEGRYFKDETEHQWYSFRDECFAWNNVVTAWMPLPEPYKSESEGKE